MPRVTLFECVSRRRHEKLVLGQGNNVASNTRFTNVPTSGSLLARGPATLRVAISCSRMNLRSPISGAARLYGDAAMACCA